jgi:hypothetical protein
VREDKTQEITRKTPRQETQCGRDILGEWLVSPEERERLREEEGRLLRFLSFDVITDVSWNLISMLKI